MDDKHILELDQQLLEAISDEERAADYHSRLSQTVSSPVTQTQLVSNQSPQKSTHIADRIQKFSPIYHGASGTKLGKVIGYGAAGAGAIGLVSGLVWLYNAIMKPDQMNHEEAQKTVKVISDRFEEILHKEKDPEKLSQLKKSFEDFSILKKSIDNRDEYIVKNPDGAAKAQSQLVSLIRDLPTTLSEKFEKLVKYGASGVAALGAGYGALKAYQHRNKESEYSPEKAPAPETKTERSSGLTSDQFKRPTPQGGYDPHKPKFEKREFERKPYLGNKPNYKIFNAK